MKMPAAGKGATERFHELVPGDTRVAVRKMFGQPAAFANGNLFFGVFGDDVFVRLSEADQKSAEKIPGVRPFEPMEGRAMRGYWVLPTPVLASRSKADGWVAKALAYALTLPPK